MFMIECGKEYSINCSLNPKQHFNKQTSDFASNQRQESGWGIL